MQSVTVSSNDGTVSKEAVFNETIDGSDDR